MDIEETRSFWKVASTFPADKEAAYPEHAKAHEFDDIRPDDVCLEYGCGGGSDARSMIKRGAFVVATDVVPENVSATNVSLGLPADPHFARFGISEDDLARMRLANPRATLHDDRRAWFAKGYVERCSFKTVPAAMNPAHGFAVLLEQSAPLFIRDAAFYRINCHGVLHHIPEPTMHEVIDEFHRVLKPSGCLYAMLYTEHLFAKLQPNIEALLKKGWDVERAFSYFTDGGGIARPYSLGGGRELFEDHGFAFVSAIEYNAGDFRTFKVCKP